MLGSNVVKRVVKLGTKEALCHFSDIDCPVQFTLPMVAYLHCKQCVRATEHKEELLLVPSDQIGNCLVSWLQGYLSEALWLWELELAFLSSATLLSCRHANASDANAVTFNTVLQKSMVSCLSFLKLSGHCSTRLNTG